MIEPKDLKHEQNLEEIKNLRHTIEALTQGLGSTVQRHGEDIAVLKDNVKDLRTGAWFLFISSMSVVVLAFWKLVLK